MATPMIEAPGAPRADRRRRSSAAASWARRSRCASRSAGLRGHRHRARHPRRRGVERRGRDPGPADGGRGAGAAAGARAAQPGAVSGAGRRAARGRPASTSATTKSGVLAVALDEAEEAELAARRTWQLARGLRVEPLSGDGGARAASRRSGPTVRAALALPRRRPGQRARAGARLLAGGRRGGRALPARAATCAAW